MFVIAVWHSSRKPLLVPALPPDAGRRLTRSISFKVDECIFSGQQRRRVHGQLSL